MTCAEVQASLSLYLYGELDFAGEESIETHIDECAFCHLALDREKEWHAAVNKQQRDIDPEWLSECRTGLYRRISSEPTVVSQARQIALSWWHDLFDIRVTERSYRLAGISFLLLLGFCTGRMVTSFQAPTGASSKLFDSAGFMQPAVTQVQEIRPESGNRVRIVLQQMQMREITGNRDDDDVRNLLLGATRQSDDPGVRMDSVEILSGQTGLEIRNAIVNAIRNDRSAAVRIKAVESLRHFPLDAVTRDALEFALAHDSDAGVQTEAMDILVPTQGDFQVTPKLLETISTVMQSAQSDEYLRWRCAQILDEQTSSHVIH